MEWQRPPSYLDELEEGRGHNSPESNIAVELRDIKNKNKNKNNKKYQTKKYKFISELNVKMLYFIFIILLESTENHKFSHFKT